jgi:hypothetical protein
MSEFALDGSFDGFEPLPCHADTRYVTRTVPGAGPQVAAASSTSG